jgi:hypothetical protein
MSITRQAELNFHFLEHFFALSGSNQMAKHMLDSQVFRPKFRPNQWYMCDVLCHIVVKMV